MQKHDSWQVTIWGAFYTVVETYVVKHLILGEEGSSNHWELIIRLRDRWNIVNFEFLGGTYIDDTKS